ncbi:MAG TPA: DUF1080 domain-containing protein, partial [Campylobacterales bacterium]|nr:DUF1080 domain-containing protein [Campylobacterales bacterium]
YIVDLILGENRMNFNKQKRFFIGGGFIGGTVILGVAAWNYAFAGATAPNELEYLPKKEATAKPSNPSVSSVVAKDGVLSFNFEAETVGAAPKTFVPVVGNWIVGQDVNNKVLVVDGRAWSKGQTASGIAERARSLYGERYAEFLDNVQAFAYYPYALANGVEDFRNGTITLKFKGIDGRIDQAAGILFNAKANGDYLAIRANPLENNLVLWKFERGKRTSEKWVKNVVTPSKEWHELKLIISGAKIEGYVNGKLYLEYTLPKEVSGKIGIWSKADSVVYYDDYTVYLK